jgi:hypothetical protein
MLQVPVVRVHIALVMAAYEDEWSSCMDVLHVVGNLPHNENVMKHLLQLSSICLFHYSLRIHHLQFGLHLIPIDTPIMQCFTAQRAHHVPLPDELHPFL